MAVKTRETEAIQEMIEEQMNQIAYELLNARQSCKTLGDYISDNLLDSPPRRELRRTAQHIQNSLDNLMTFIENAPRS